MLTYVYSNIYIFNLLIEKYRIIFYIMIRCNKMFYGGRKHEKSSNHIYQSRYKRNIFNVCVHEILKKKGEYAEYYFAGIMK